MRVDLHIHTTASDGSWSPEAVVRGAAAGGLDVIAVTDHDTTAGCEVAAAVGREVDVRVVPGVEVSSTFQGRDVHVLGYFVDPTADALVTHEDRAGRRREERMREMVARLSGAGVDVTYADVEAAAGPDVVAIGRPHLASALVLAGHVPSVQRAFETLIGDRSDAFVPTQLLDPAGAVEVILRAGGIPVWAHPPGDLVDTLLPALLEAGLRGLEVYRPRHRRGELVRLEGICRTSGLLLSGGSDWHGPVGGSELGDFSVDARDVEALLEAGRM
jgi:predicted metal-dependent phosphoesterase TrpH